MKIHRLIWVASTLFYLSSPAAAVNQFGNYYDKFIIKQKQSCKNIDDGELEISEGGVQYSTDFNGDGITDPIINENALTCSSSATLFSGGSGGGYITVFTSQKAGGFLKFEFQALDYAVVALGPRPTLLLALHGIRCGLTGSQPCHIAYTFAGGEFVTGGPDTLRPTK